MPGVYRYSVDILTKILNQVSRFKIPMIALFHIHLVKKKIVKVQKL